MTDRIQSGTTVTAAYYHQFLLKLRCEMHANRPDLLENGVLILRDNARPQLGKDVRELLDRYSWEVLPHPPYSPDMSPPDFDLFPKLKINMHGMHFSTLEDLRVVAVPETRTAAISTLRRFQVHTPSETNYTALAAWSSPVQLLKWRER